VKNTGWFGKQRASVQVAVVGGLLAALGGAVTGTAQIISAEISKPVAATSSPAIPAVSSGQPIGTYVTIALAVQPGQLKVTLYFGQLKSIIDLLRGYVAFSTDPALLNSDPEQCAETVVFTGVTGSSGIVAASGFGQGWGAAELAPSRSVAGPDRNLHQQILTPPASATSGGVWDAYDELITGHGDARSATYELALVTRNGNSWVWLIDQQHEVACSS
jgi:hypothetical protein